MWVSVATLPQKESQRGKIVRVGEEPRSYEVQLSSGAVLRRNRKELQKATNGSEAQKEEEIDMERMDQ